MASQPAPAPVLSTIRDRLGVRPYAVAAAAVAAALLLRVALAPLLGDQRLFSVFVPAVVAAAWAGGWRPAALATVLSCLGALWVHGTFRIPGAPASDVPVAFALGMFVVASTAAAWLGELRLRAHRRAERLLRRARHEAERAAEAASAAEASARELQDLFDSATIGLHWVGPDGTILRANPAELEMLGYAEAEYIGHSIVEFHVDRPVIDDILCRLNAGEVIRDYPARLRARDGSIRDVLISSSVYRLDGEFHHTRCFTRDVTAQREAEEAARALQRLESVGRLAGGIAHEVNNQMNVVLGASGFILRRGDLPAQVRDDVSMIVSAATRSAAITSQLLAFSRRLMLRPQVHDPREIVRGFEAVLRRSLGPLCRLRLNAAPDVGNVRVDRAQLEQVLLNLILNAVDAMPAGGTVSVWLEDATLDGGPHRGINERSVEPGKYVAIAVADTGVGMDADTQSHLFEPFFTTKAVGKGTGLGLSTVYGIVRQSGGYVRVESVVGKGSTFTVYLPVTDEPAPAPLASAPRGRSSVLVVEDDQR